MRASFANCVLDFGTRVLRREGKVVHLPPKAFTLLEYLICARPRLVTRAELDELLWPRSYVARSSLGRLVAELRAAIGDDARAPTMIRTAHGVGYAFCAEVASAPVPAGLAAFVLTWRDQTYPLGEGEHLIGRDAGCRVVVDALGVSRQHARVEVSGRHALIGDLASKNGTFINQKRIAGPTPLEHLDEIGIGTAVLTVRQMTDSANTQTIYRP